MRNITNRGFTYIEAILYIAIISLMLTALIPFTWNIVESGSKSSMQQEVGGNARYISERIKYEVRNALGINSGTCVTPTSTSIFLCETGGSCLTNPTIIKFSSPNISIQNKGAVAVNLNSNDVIISNFTCSNNTSSDNKTKNISFSFTVSQANTSSRSDFQYSIPVATSVEVRGN